MNVAKWSYELNLKIIPTVSWPQVSIDSKQEVSKSNIVPVMFFSLFNWRDINVCSSVITLSYLLYPNVIKKNTTTNRYQDSLLTFQSLPMLLENFFLSDPMALRNCYSKTYLPLCKVAKFPKIILPQGVLFKFEYRLKIHRENIENVPFSVAALFNRIFNTLYRIYLRFFQKC